MKMYAPQGNKTVFTVVTDKPFTMDEYLEITNKDGLIELPDGKTMRYLMVSENQKIACDLIMTDFLNCIWGLRIVGNQDYPFICFLIKNIKE